MDIHITPEEAQGMMEDYIEAYSEIVVLLVYVQKETDKSKGL